MISIREAKKQDCDNIHEVYLDAFTKEEAKSVASLDSALLNEKTSPQTMALVAEKYRNRGQTTVFNFTNRFAIINLRIVPMRTCGSDSIDRYLFSNTSIDV